jgi:hypothetical protein
MRMKMVALFSFILVRCKPMGNSYENMRLRTNIDKKLPMFLKNGRLWQSYRHG